MPDLPVETADSASTDVPQTPLPGPDQAQRLSQKQPPKDGVAPAAKAAEAQPTQTQAAQTLIDITVREARAVFTTELTATAAKAGGPKAGG